MWKLNEQAGASGFPFLFGGTFIEGHADVPAVLVQRLYFPSFSEGLSLRVHHLSSVDVVAAGFPFLFGGTFIEGLRLTAIRWAASLNFPSFSEGLSLRVSDMMESIFGKAISLPFRRDFH